jgi:hypothetical protein
MMGAMKFRKKPVVIEAMRIPIESEDGEEAFLFGHGELLGWFIRHEFDEFMVADDLGIDIYTLEGVMHATPGDWIIRGVQGEFYPCKPDIFDATYEPVEP